MVPELLILHFQPASHPSVLLRFPVVTYKDIWVNLLKPSSFTPVLALIGIIFWNDPFSIVVGIGMIAVVAGIALLSKGTQEAEEAELACEQG